MVSRRRPPCHLKPAMSRMRVSRRRTSPAPVTWPEDYFRFLALRFVFFAAFGAAFAFLRFAIVPSKLEMALSIRAIANRPHDVSITTERRKQRLHLTKRVLAASVASVSACDASRVHAARVDRSNRTFVARATSARLRTCCDKIRIS
jgi:hypothetical protein